MSFTHRTIATVTFPYFPLNPTPKTVIAPNFTHLRSLNYNKTLISVNPKLSFQIRASATDDGTQTPWWVNLLPAKALGADKVLRLISGATASPICQYVSEPVTFLHSLDPRIKLVCSILMGTGWFFITFGGLALIWFAGFDCLSFGNFYLEKDEFAFVGVRNWWSVKLHVNLHIL